MKLIILNIQYNQLLKLKLYFWDASVSSFTNTKAIKIKINYFVNIKFLFWERVCSSNITLLKTKKLIENVTNHHFDETIH